MKPDKPLVQNKVLHVVALVVAFLVGIVFVIVMIASAYQLSVTNTGGEDLSGAGLLIMPAVIMFVSVPVALIFSGSIFGFMKLLKMNVGQSMFVDLVIFFVALTSIPVIGITTVYVLADFF